MEGLALIVAAVATSLLAAASMRLPSLVSTLLVAYLAYVADLTGCVLVLSPFDDVARPEIAILQGLLLSSTLLIWWRLGRPCPALRERAATLRRLATDLPALLFIALTLAALAYEFVLVASAPANDYDGLAYHLVRAAEWVQHGGYFWVPNAPYDPINEYPPLAEQQILFSFAAIGKGLFFALPQYTAELAILLAVYGSARRLGYDARAAVGAAALFASFGLVGLEATTAQNDLVAASFPVVAAYLFLGRMRAEFILGGVAVGIALGVKLTTVVVLPILLVLILLRGRKATLAALLGACGAFVALSLWVYVLNLAHTGHLLGHGGGRVGNDASPAYPTTLITALSILYTMMDLSVLSNHLIRVLEYTGIAGAACVLAVGLVRRERIELALIRGARVLIPFLSPLIVIGGGDVLAWVARLLGHPIRGPGGTIGALTRGANSGISAFGPLGAVALCGVVALTLVASLTRRGDARQLALAMALPLFLVVLASFSKWNAYLPRFFLVPAALSAPLVARLLRGRIVAAAYLAVGATVLWLTITHDQGKPLASVYGSPWHLSRLQALALVQPEDAPMLAAYDRLVPPVACVGAILGQDEPSYLLFGPRLGRDVVFLPAAGLAPGEDTVAAAYSAGTSYVVISTGMGNRIPAEPGPLAGEFASAGWRLRALGGYWTLAVAPHVVPGGCPN